MKIYKVYYRTGNGNESYTFIEADSKEMIESVLHHVQGMTTELIRFEEVQKMFKVYCRSKAHRQWKPYSQPFINKENAEKCKVKCESRRICDVHGNLIEYKIMEEKQ